MASHGTFGYLALLGRTVGLGLERPLVKALGRNRDSIAATTVYFGIGELLLLPVIAWQWWMARGSRCRPVRSVKWPFSDPIRSCF